ncbi:hypothetical protein [Micromonospora sp. WMMC250]|uniref:hypothetical protein n=1 Tax=Micromonospora sp. WMMC250 TaxID=3014781 RepID=UPI0022B694DE|nr:hypothetical protein [Micromonospora sp. WMMC250]MCZ7375235.1 hypothetical protein [Micromonospora sp. WMMC250]
MSAPISAGYLTPAEERIQSGTMTVTSAQGMPVAEGQPVPDWDYFTDLTATWPLHVDLPGLLQDCGLSSDAAVTCLVTWHSSSTNRRGNSLPAELADGGNELTVVIPGTEIGGNLTVTARMVLAVPDPAPVSPLAASLPGAILWQARRRFALEGSGSRFPVVATSFADSGLAEGRRALWYLSCTPDLDGSDTGSIRLYLNTDHPAITTMLNHPDAETSRTLADMLRHDVVRQLIETALRCEDLQDDHDYGEGTLGELFINLTRRYFADRSLADLRSQHRSDPGELEAVLQGLDRVLA